MKVKSLLKVCTAREVEIKECYSGEWFSYVLNYTETTRVAHPRRKIYGSMYDMPERIKNAEVKYVDNNKFADNITITIS